MKDKKTKMPKGYGFVVFKSDKTFQRIKSMTHVLNGRTLDINIGCKKENAPEMIEQRKRKMIYVGGVPQAVTERKKSFWEYSGLTFILEEFGDYFKMFGEVKKAYLIWDQHHNKHKGEL